MGRKWGFSWSWRRALGLSGLKSKIAQRTGIPLTRGGQQRKVGAMLGWLTPVIIVVSALATCLG
jgi:hypothetical protein